jgi:hypothetical protein
MFTVIVCVGRFQTPPNGWTFKAGGRPSVRAALVFSVSLINVRVHFNGNAELRVKAAVKFGGRAVVELNANAAGTQVTNGLVRSVIAGDNGGTGSPAGSGAGVLSSITL